MTPTQAALLEALKPCPFCGSRPTLTVRPNNAEASEYFAAVSCFCGGYSACAHKMATAPEAADAEAMVRVAWNGRAAEAAQPEPMFFDAEGFHAFVLRELPDQTIVGSSRWWADHLSKWAAKFCKRAQPAPIAAQPNTPDKQNADEWQSAVFTLMGHAAGLYAEGKHDMPAWCYGLAEKIARAHLDDAHGDRVQQVAAQQRAMHGEPADSAPIAAQAAPTEPVTMPSHWSVSVTADGDTLVSIGNDWLSGSRALEQYDERVIIGAAQHLLSFVGYGLPPCNFDPDADNAPQAERCPHCDDTGDVNSIIGEWRGYCHCPAVRALAAQAGPAQAPLTEDRLRTMAAEAESPEWGEWYSDDDALIRFARAVERAAQAPASTRPADASISGQRVDTLSPGWREIVEQLIACHDEPTCPAVAVAKEWLAAAPQAPAEPAAQAVEQDATLPVHEVWREGYRITGETARALKLGEARAFTFEEACDIVCADMPGYSGRAIWGCRLFNNEADARRFAG